MTQGATLRNMGLVAASIKGWNDVGGLVGYQLNGSIQQRLCHRAGQWQLELSAGWLGYQWNGSISNAYATGQVSGSGQLSAGGRLPIRAAASATPMPPGRSAARRQRCRRAGRLPNRQRRYSGTITLQLLEYGDRRASHPGRRFWPSDRRDRQNHRAAEATGNLYRLEHRRCRRHRHGLAHLRRPHWAAAAQLFKADHRDGSIPAASPAKPMTAQPPVAVSAATPRTRPGAALSGTLRYTTNSKNAGQLQNGRWLAEIYRPVL